MNWMTSGKHRALYSQRGRRRQMCFPSQVQQQRVQPSSSLRSSEQARARDSSTPWYIVPVGDEDESQDIRVLELERKGAMTAADVEADGKARETEQIREHEGGSGARPSPSQKRSREHEAQKEKSDSRCIFTPVKKVRQHDQPLCVLQRTRGARGKRPPSSITSGVDMLFFNDGEELPHKKRVQRKSQVVTEQAPSKGPSSRYSQYTSEHAVKGTQQLPHEYYREQEVQSRHPEAKQDSSDGESSRFHGGQAFSDSANGSDQRDFQLWRVNSNSHAASSPDTTFARPDSPPFRNPSEIIYSHDTLPPTPFAASPLSFRMSRAEVLQSQHSKAHMVQPSLEDRMTFTPSPRPSPSPSTSTSSQGSILLGRPPLGWQRKLLLSLNEDTSDKPEQQVPFPEVVLASPINLLDRKLKNDQNLLVESSPSPRGSPESDGDNSTIDAIVPIDAKECLLAATTSQQHPGDSRSWLQRPAMTKSRDTNEGGAVFSGQSLAFQQSWVMSSRTKTILDAVSTSKALAPENTLQKNDTKYQEMESVAIYMYTLVQCYKIDENLRTDRHSSPVAKNTQLVSEATTSPTIAALVNRTSSRREIIFSPRHAN